MRLSDLNGKEVINLTDGSKLGVLFYPEADLDLRLGQLSSFKMTSGRWPFRQERIIPWKAVRKISTDVLLVELAAETGEEG
ncbi:MAG TPA: YlmC/YmxH family sporulation protein [Firmicutes bacterium]|jgi:YlmC/YmxH family sporulation protein|nr:YlmC/YmxH family sporulation protein [Bacillota bacterium]